MEVAYTSTPIKYNLDFASVSSRILTTNLLKNKKIKPEFSTACLYTSMWEVRDKLWDTFSNKSIRHTIGLEGLMFMLDNMPTEKYKKLLTNMKSEIVLLGIFHLLDLMAVMHLLNDNRKVVIGGAIPMLYEPKFIRNILKKMGAKNVDKNLIVVHGHVDLTTDLYQIIKEWKDTKIVVNDFTTIWDCTDDFIQRLIKIKRRIRPIKEENSPIPPSHVQFILNLKCHWGKCKFCAYKRMPLCDFRDDTSRIAKSIKETMRKYDRKIVRFADSYFEFSPENLEIIEKIRNEVTVEKVFLGVHSLMKYKNIEYANKYTNFMFIGVESFSNYTLNTIRKGYRVEQIDKMIDNFIKYLDRRIVLTIFLMGDLPAKDIDDVKRNYEKAIKVKERLTKEGFKIKYGIQPLQLNPLVELDDSLIIGDNSIPTGIGKLIEVLKSKGVRFFDDIEDPTVINDIFIPYHRGMPSDYDMISKDEIEYLTSWS